MSHSPLEYIRHILDELIYVEDVSSGLEQNEFLSDETLKRSFVRSIEIIGEASKKLDDDFKHKYPDIEWKKITGMRDKLVHDYFGVDYHIVWNVVKEKLPILKRQVTQILDTEI